MWKQGISLLSMVFLVVSCGSTEGINFQSVTGIVPGDGAGDALSGEFAVNFTYTSNGCAEHSELEIPAQGTTVSLDVSVAQDGGAMTFDKVHVILRGSISFANRFEVGGADLLDVGESVQNVLRMVSLKGSFENPNEFSANGQERLTGSLEEEEVDCTYSFTAEGTRKAQ